MVLRQSEQVTFEEPKLVESDNYQGLNELANWVKSNLPDSFEEEGKDPEEILKLVVEKVGDCFPIKAGYGKATISEQIDFWKENKSLFDKELKVRELLVSIIERLTVLNDNDFLRRDRIKDIDIHKLMVDNNLISKVIFFLRTASEEKEKKKLTEDLDSNKLIKDRLLDVLEKNKYFFNFLTANLDCKLPTVIAGRILEELGWKVSMLCGEHPEHPRVLISRIIGDSEELKFIIDFRAGSRHKFRSIPYIQNYHERLMDFSKYYAKEKGFISENDSWPLPFNDETFSRFDSWFEKVDAEKKQQKEDET